MEAVQMIAMTFFKSTLDPFVLGLWALHYSRLGLFTVQL